MGGPSRPRLGLKLASLLGGPSGSREALSICRSSSVSSTSRRYRYDRPVALGPQVIRLRPAPHTRTAIRSYSLKVTPAQHFVNWQQDPNGNWLARFVFPERTTEFSIAVDLLADMSVINPFDFFVDPVATNYPFVYPSEFDEELAPYLSKEPAGPRLTEYLKSLPRAQQSIIDFLVELNQRLQRDIRYLVRMEPGVQTTEETLTLAVGLLPRLGLAAGAGAAASRSRRALRVRLPDPAEAPTSRRSTARPARRRTSPICTPGPRSICRAPAGSGSIPHPGC